MLMPSFVFAGNDDSYGLETTAKAADLKKFGANLPELIGNVIGTALSLISVIFFALMIYGGVRWMLSRGNEDQSKKALDTIIGAIIGIIIVLASYAITTFVFNSVGSTAGAGNTTNPVVQDTPPAKKANGAACTTGSECTSGICTGGVCSTGTEGNVPGSIPEGGACILSSDCVAQGLYCDSNNVCSDDPNTTVCFRSDSENCIPDAGGGQCVSPDQKFDDFATCQLFQQTYQAPDLQTACQSDLDCFYDLNDAQGTSASCQNSVCVIPDSPTGTCTTNSQCDATTYCVAGQCILLNNCESGVLSCPADSGCFSGDPVAGMNIDTNPNGICVKKNSQIWIDFTSGA